MTDTINDNLSLTVINDNAGDQCGFSYKERCNIFAQHFSAVTHANKALQMVNKANLWMTQQGYESASAAELLDQAAKVTEYYIEHVKELVA